MDHDVVPQKVENELATKTVDSAWRYTYSLDLLIGFGHVAWRCFKNLALARLAKLRTVSGRWKQGIEQFLHSGFLTFDVQLELRAIGVQAGVDGFWRGFEDGEILNPDDEFALTALVDFVTRHCSGLQSLRMLHGIEPWMLGRMQHSTSALINADIWLTLLEAPKDQIENLSNWITDKWGRLQSLTLVLELGVFPSQVAEWLCSISTSCRALRRINIRIETTTLPLQPCADLLESMLQLSSLQSLGLVFELSGALPVPVNVEASLESLQCGAPTTAAHHFWHDYIVQLLPCLPQLRVLMLSNVEVTPYMANIICTRCENIETLFLDECKSTSNLVARLAELQENGDVKWLPKLSKLQTQEGGKWSKDRLTLLRGWSPLAKRPHLQVFPDVPWQEHLEDYDHTYKDIWRQWLSVLD